MNSVVLLEMSKPKPKKITKRGTWQVTLHDDAVNTFDHVIDCLVDICAHNEFQAHQCALIVHNRKRCVIYKDTWAGCDTVKHLLRAEGLTVTVEKHEKND
jgi:ATP-dependent Clp protease adaptor protein ClpS